MIALNIKDVTLAMKIQKVTWGNVLQSLGKIACILS